MHGLRRMYLGHGNHFGHTRSYSYVTLVKRKLVSVCLEVVLISGQHRYTVCAECTMGMEIILAVPDGTPGDVGQGEARFSPFGDSVSLDAR